MVHNIDLGAIAKKIDSMAEFGVAFWGGHIDATLRGISKLKPEIIDALQRLQSEIDISLFPDPH